MKYKMIVLDLDDTLLLNNGKISKENKEILKLVQEKGIKVVLASGRPTFAIKNIANELELDKYSGYILGFNGARIIDYRTKEILYQIDLNKNQIGELYELSLKYETYAHTYNETEIITSNDNPYTYIESEITGMKINVCEDFMNYVPEKCVKFMLLQSPEYLKEVEQLLKPIISNKMTMTITKPFFLEFMNKEVDKGKSIKRLCKILDIKTNDIIAIGDSYNDISMLKVAGLSIAMGNSVEDVKEIADFVTDTNENNGVAKAIEKYIFN